MTNRFPNWRGDAGYWDDNAAATGWKVEGVPMADSIAVWQPGTASAWGHVGYVADTRVSSGVLQMKVYDRNWDGNGGNRNGVWLNARSDQRFIVAPPQTEALARDTQVIADEDRQARAVDVTEAAVDPTMNESGFFAEPREGPGD